MVHVNNIPAMQILARIPRHNQSKSYSCIIIDWVLIEILKFWIIEPYSY